MGSAKFKTYDWASEMSSGNTGHSIGVIGSTLVIESLLRCRHIETGTKICNLFH